MLILADGQDGEWHNTDARTLTANGTGNNAFPSFVSDGSEVRQLCPPFSCLLPQPLK